MKIENKSCLDILIINSMLYGFICKLSRIFLILFSSWFNCSHEMKWDNLLLFKMRIVSQSCRIYFWIYTDFTGVIIWNNLVSINIGNDSFCWLRTDSITTCQIITKIACNVNASQLVSFTSYSLNSLMTYFYSAILTVLGFKFCYLKTKGRHSHWIKNDLNINCWVSDSIINNIVGSYERAFKIRWMESTGVVIFFTDFTFNYKELNKTDMWFFANLRIGILIIWILSLENPPFWNSINLWSFRIFVWNVTF